MKKYFSLIICTIFLLLFSTNKVEATERDHRVTQMRVVLAKYKSPLVGLENVLINTAEKYGLDWTLMAAIAGTESSFAKRMPANCNNPYGWGIYGDHKICFKTLEESIEGVASGLAKKYNISTLESIACTYNKVSTFEWIGHTKYFINLIKTAEVPVSTLPITL